MSTQILNLPFQYAAYVLPGPRHRIAHTLILRDYTSVPILEIDPRDMVPAIEYDSYERLYEEVAPVSGPIYAWQGRLYRPAMSKDRSRQLDVHEFGDAVSTNWSHFVRDAGKPPLADFDVASFPARGIRWGMLDPHPLSYKSIDAVASELKWGDRYRILRSSRDRETGSAQQNLAEAVVISEGKVFLECAEPVWAVDAYGENPRGTVRVRLEPVPSDALAYNYFRLDLLGEARDWAVRAGGCGDAPNEINVLADEAVQRDDEWLLACHVIKYCSHLKGPLGLESENDPRERAGELADGYRREERPPSPEEAEEFLEALVMSAEARGDEAFTGHDRTDAVLACVRERWLLATRSGRGLNSRPYLDDDDIEALRDLPFYD